MRNNGCFFACAKRKSLKRPFLAFFADVLANKKVTFVREL
jgi:hypothetical protein